MLPRAVAALWRTERTMGGHRAARREAWIVAVLAGIAGLLAALTAAPRAAAGVACGGLLDVVFVHLARAAPKVSLEAASLALNAPIAFVACAIVGVLLHAVTGRAVLAVAASAALAFSPSGTIALAPATHVAAMGASACALLYACTSGGPRATDVAGFAIGCALLVVLVPPLLVPVTGAAAAYAWLHRGDKGWRPWAALAVWTIIVSAAASATVLQAAKPDGSGVSAMTVPCLIPPGPRDPISQLPASAAAVGGGGPLAAVLAAVGVFGTFGRVAARPATAGTMLAAATLFAATGPGDALAVVAPVMVVFWCAVSVGMRTISEWVASPPARTVGAGALALVVPWLQFEHRALRAHATPPAVPAIAASTSARGLWQTLRAVPAGAIVADDRGSALLVQAISPQLRGTGRSARVLGADDASVREALAAGPVYAFAPRWAELRHRGVVLEPAHPALGDLARVNELRPCAALTADWRVATELAGITQFALVADREDAFGVAVVVLGGAHPLDAWPVAWPATATSGFLRQSASEGADEGLRQRLRGEGVLAGWAADATRHLLQLEVWRTPAAPLSLAVALRQPAQAPVVRVAPGTSPAGLRLCPSTGE